MAARWYSLAPSAIHPLIHSFHNSPCGCNFLTFNTPYHPPRAPFPRVINIGGGSRNSSLARTFHAFEAGRAAFSSCTRHILVFEAQIVVPASAIKAIRAGATLLGVACWATVLPVDATLANFSSNAKCTHRNHLKDGYSATYASRVINHWFWWICGNGFIAVNFDNGNFAAMRKPARVRNNFWALGKRIYMGNKMPNIVYYMNAMLTYSGFSVGLPAAASGTRWRDKRQSKAMITSFILTIILVDLVIEMLSILQWWFIKQTEGDFRVQKYILN